MSYERGEAWVKYDDRKVTVAHLREIVNGTGFKAAGIITARPKKRGGRKPS